MIICRKRSITIICLIALTALLALMPLTAQEVGAIDYLEGIVDIHRDGEIVELFSSDIGFSIEAVDTIRTGSDGRVDFTLTHLANRGSTVSIGPDTTFRIETQLDSAGSKTRLEVFTGAVSLKVAKLAGREELSVRTESAVMGVRGTSFDVLTAPDGGVLVLCDEGRVSCQDLNQQERFAYAGQAVEKVPGDSINALEVAPDQFEEFSTAWKQTRLEIFRSGAPVFLKAYAQQFIRVEPRFREAYRSLAAFETRLKDYADRAGREGASLSTGEMVRFRAQISPALGQMRSIVPFYRQVFFRLDELADIALSEGLARGISVDEMPLEEFYQEFRQKLRQRREQIARVDYWFKLYIDFSSSSTDDPFGGESLMDDFFAPGESSLLDEF